MLHNGKKKKDLGIVDAEFTCIGNPHDITAEVLLTPRHRAATELISMPRAEYERLIRTEENFTRICNLLSDNSLSPYTIGEVVKALFPEKTAPFGGSVPQPDTEAASGSPLSITKDLLTRSDSAGEAATSESEGADA